MTALHRRSPFDRARRLWAGLTQVHVLLDGHRIKTLPSRLDARDLARLTAAGARPAGPPPLPPASGDLSRPKPGPGCATPAPAPPSRPACQNP
jgi:hypothetical protein